MTQPKRDDYYHSVGMLFIRSQFGIGFCLAKQPNSQVRNTKEENKLPCSLFLNLKLNP
jgi:hypothetical protein